MRSLTILHQIFLLTFPRWSNGHGYLKSPRSRNQRAFEEGLDPGVPGATTSTPKKDYCPHCINRVGTCGSADNRDFDYNVPKSILGNALPFNAQETYDQGQVIDVEHVITAHHKGHVELKACPIQNDNDVPTQECFDMFPLLFLSDDLYGSYGLGPDNNHRMRSYIYQGAGTQYGNNPPGMLFKLKYRLPPNLNGNKILLQYKYITANTCFDIGYRDYNFPFTYPNLSDCHQPLPWNGEVGGPYKPEQFWNCAEIKIRPAPGAAPTPIPKPRQGVYGVSMPTPAPKQATSTPTQAPRNRCGSSWSDAVQKCGSDCTTSADCGSAEYCFSSVGCSSGSGDGGQTGSGPSFFFCGQDRIDATKKCGTECPSGSDSDCPVGEFCFRGVFECAEAKNKFCGMSKEDAKDLCTHPCDSDSDCPQGEACHDDVTTCYPDYVDPTSPTASPTPNVIVNNYCGISWEDANKSCQQQCPNGTDDECTVVGHKCFSDCSGCVNDNDGPGTNDPSAKFFCGTNWSDASNSCAKECPSGMDNDCPADQYCFAETGCDSSTNGNYNYCGTSWSVADSQCSTSCFGGTNDECPAGQTCFADCTSCPEVTRPSTATPVSEPSPRQPTLSPVTRAPFAKGECNTQEKMTVNVGYYQSWAIWRNNCLVVAPKDIDIEGMGYTHLIYSFASISSAMTLEPWNGVISEEGPQMLEMNALKQTYPHLKTLIAVGGWSHNDPGKFCDRFSTVAGTAENREKFAASVLSFLRTYNFDGIDFDWEYPNGDSNRCGKPEDKDNYALLVEAVRNAMSTDSTKYLITMAIPITESTLEKGYDLTHLTRNLDWFNVMSYDISGTWSDVVGSHTDMKMINDGIQYILSRNVPSTSIVIGLGAYGRTFSLSDTTCMDVGCPFNGARGGGCPVWDEEGYTAYDSILDIVSSGQYVKNVLNPATQSMELVTNDYEFISYDSKETFSMKTLYASEQCLRGYMWWAVDMIGESFSVDVDSPTTSPAPSPPPVTMAPYKQEPCDQVKKMSVNVGYYQSWAVWRPNCLVVYPEDIDIDGMGYTHLIYSFASLSSSLTIEPWNGAASEEIPRMKAMNALKQKHPHLKTLIAVGGWTHNDPGLFCDRFTRVSETASNRLNFATSVVNFLKANGFDGIDFDWEYPGDTSRCGKSADKVNYGLLIQAVREAFTAQSLATGNDEYLITMAVPISKVALDRGYNLPHLAANLDFFNVMSYDIAGYWSTEVGSHSDMGFIRTNIPYLLEQGVPSTSIVLGLGSYGRTFSLSDTNCIDVGCPFNGARGGGCPVWDEQGYMAYDSILDIVESGQFVKHELNSETESMELVTKDYEFISYDSEKTFSMKASYASAMCMRGYMWWAVDMIDESFSIELRSPTTSPRPSVSSMPSLSPSVSKQPATSEPTAKPVSGPSCAPGHTGWVPYLQCTHYFYCSNGNVIGIPHECPEGTLWDINYTNCNWKDQVQCPLTPSTISPVPSNSPSPTRDIKEPECPTGHTGWLAYQYCTQYFYCQNGQVLGVPYACPPKTLYDELLQNCNWADQVDCQSKQTLAPVISSTHAPVKASTSAPVTSPTLFPTTEPSSSAAPSEENRPDTLSWLILEGTTPIVSTNEQGENVIQIRYQASNREYGVAVFQKDCETSTDMPSVSFSDSASSEKGFINIDVDLTVSQVAFENALDNGLFRFCLSTFLLSNGDRVVVRKNDIFTMVTSDLAGFSLGNIAVSSLGETEHNGLSLMFGGKIDAYECDPGTKDPIVEPQPHGQFDKVHICLKETAMDEFAVSEIESLTVEGFVNFNYVVGGAVPQESEGLVTSSCADGVCLASVQLINEFFVSDNVESVTITGSVRLEIKNNVRGGKQEAEGTYALSVGLDRPCREERSVVTELTKLLLNGL